MLRGATCATAMAALLYFGMFQHVYTGATMYGFTASSCCCGSTS